MVDLPEGAEKVLRSVADNDADFATYISVFSTQTAIAHDTSIKDNGGRTPQRPALIRDGLILHLLARVYVLQEQVAVLEKVVLS